jgi:hypothetical protein
MITDPRRLCIRAALLVAIFVMRWSVARADTPMPPCDRCPVMIGVALDAELGATAERLMKILETLTREAPEFLRRYREAEDKKAGTYIERIKLRVSAIEFLVSFGSPEALRREERSGTGATNAK